MPKVPNEKKLPKLPKLPKVPKIKRQKAFPLQNFSSIELLYPISDKIRAFYNRKNFRNTQSRSLLLSTFNMPCIKSAIHTCLRPILLLLARTRRFKDFRHFRQFRHFRHFRHFFYNPSSYLPTDATLL
jgi:hypothetical protein